MTLKGEGVHSFSKVRVPRGAGPLGAVEPLPVGRERVDVNLGHAGRGGLTCRELDGLVKPGRPWHPMEPGQGLEIPVGRLARKLLGPRPSIGPLICGAWPSAPRNRSRSPAGRRRLPRPS